LLPETVPPDESALTFSWGLGQPTTGEYDTSSSGRKNFGGQGQGPKSEAWKRPDDPECSDRYMMVLVQSKNPTDDSYIQIQFESVGFGTFPEVPISEEIPTEEKVKIVLKET